MGAMKAVWMTLQESPDLQEQLEFDDLSGRSWEPVFPESWEDDDPPEGTVFDPDHPMPF